MANPSLVLIVAITAALLAAAIGVALYMRLQGSSKVKYDQQLQELLDYENIDDGTNPKNTKPTLLQKWNRYWGILFQNAGWARYSDLNSTAGRDAAICILLCGLVAYIATGTPYAAIPAMTLLPYIFVLVVRGRSNRESEKINAQLPGFLFALKANVQSNETPERAILKIVDNMPNPLHDDLLIVKQRVLANGTFTEALQALEAKTKSRDLKFLCACMLQATASGSNLEDQITIIQNVIESRAKITHELEKAIRSVTPFIWISTIVIPGSLAFSIFMDSNTREFWFTNPLSIPALLVVGGLYGAGVWGSKKLVDNIKNL